MSVDLTQLFPCPDDICVMCSENQIEFLQNIAISQRTLNGYPEMKARGTTILDVFNH